MAQKGSTPVVMEDIVGDESIFEKKWVLKESFVKYKLPEKFFVDGLWEVCTQFYNWM